MAFYELSANFASLLLDSCKLQSGNCNLGSGTTIEAGHLDGFWTRRARVKGRFLLDFGGKG